MLVFEAIDFTRSGNRKLAIDILGAIVNSCEEKCLISIMMFGIRAYPLIDPTPVDLIDIEKLVDQIESIPAIEGPSEPYRPLREAVTTAIEYGLQQESTVVIVWGAARQPKVPLWLQALYAENSGVDWAIIISKPSPPRWIGKVLGTWETTRLYTIRRSTNISKLVSRIIGKVRD